MKITVFVTIACFLYSCASKDLSKEDAIKLLRTAFNYPKVLSENIFIADPIDAKKLLDKGLEQEGFVSIVRIQKLKDMGKPLVYFEPKSNSYLLPTPMKDSGRLQIVKVAGVDIGQITGIKVDGNSAKVEYTLAYRDQTPFIKLWKALPDSNKKHYACFELFDNGWRMVKCLN